MTTFSPTDACIEGFRVARRHPVSMIVWGLFLMLGFSLGFALLFALGLTSSLAPGAIAPGTDPTVAMLNTLKVDAVFLPISLMVTTIFLCAIYRAVLTPEDRGLAYLRLGGDEMRVFVVVLVMMVLGLLAEAVAAGVLFALVGAVYAANHIAGVLAGVIAGVVFMVLVIWVVVRLSLAYAMTFAEKRILIFRSWTLTKGRFWPLFGMYALTALICFGLFIALYILLTILIFVGLGPMIFGAGAGHTPDFAHAGPMFLVAMLIAFLVGIFGFSLVYTILYAPQAAAYRQLTAGDKAAEAF